MHKPKSLQLLRELCAALREEEVEPVEDGAHSFSGLSEDLRRILTLLSDPRLRGSAPVNLGYLGFLSDGSTDEVDGESFGSGLDIGTHEVSKPIRAQNGHLDRGTYSGSDPDCPESPSIEARKIYGGDDYRSNHFPGIKEFPVTNSRHADSPRPIVTSSIGEKPSSGAGKVFVETSGTNYKGESALHSPNQSEDRHLKTSSADGGESREDSIIKSGEGNNSVRNTARGSVEVGEKSVEERTDLQQPEKQSDDQDFIGHAAEQENTLAPSRLDTNGIASDALTPTADTKRIPITANEAAAESTETTTEYEIRPIEEHSSVHSEASAAKAQTGASRDYDATPNSIFKKTLYLTNAYTNQHYEHKFYGGEIQDLKLRDDGGIDLNFNENEQTLSGTPNFHGEFSLEFIGLMNGSTCNVIAHLAVLPHDTRSLWVPKSSDRSAKFWKEDQDDDIKPGIDLLCVAASKRGRSHAQNGMFREDDFRILADEKNEGWSISVVADGAGSAQFSRRGSQIAVETVEKKLPDLLEKHFTGQIDSLIEKYIAGDGDAENSIRNLLFNSLTTAAFDATEAISHEAEREGVRDSDFATTLVISVARKGPHGWFIAGFSIGDGGAAIFDLPSCKVVPLTLMDSGEFAGETRFLDRGEFSSARSEELSNRLLFDVRKEFTAILTMTDGITDPKFPTDAAFHSWDAWNNFWEADLPKDVQLNWQNLNRHNENLNRDLLDWLDFWSIGNHDDRTIAIMLP